MLFSMFILTRYGLAIHRPHLRLKKNSEIESHFYLSSLSSFETGGKAAGHNFWKNEIAQGHRKYNLIPRLGRSPGGGNGTPLQFFPEECHGQQNLAGYSLRGCKELCMTEQAPNSFKMWPWEHWEGLNRSATGYCIWIILFRPQSSVERCCFLSSIYRWEN